MIMNSHQTGCLTEQDAARALGYTEDTWDNLSGMETQPLSESKTWSQLTDTERAAAEVLGYDQLIWDTQPPAAATKFWESLTDTEKAAAIELGYTQITWDNESGTEVQPPFFNQVWEQMTDQQIGALVVLGYTKTSWDNWASPLPTTATKLFSLLSSTCSTCSEDHLILTQ